MIYMSIEEFRELLKQLLYFRYIVCDDLDFIVPYLDKIISYMSTFVKE